jgi:hypothetical protein
MKKLESDTVIITRKGLILAEAGELTEEDVPGVEVGTIRQLHGREPKNPNALWDYGRPLEVTVEGETTLLTRRSVRSPGTDMDGALPPEVLQRRKRLINDRMKQERRQ